MTDALSCIAAIVLNAGWMGIGASNLVSLAGGLVLR